MKHSPAILFGLLCCMSCAATDTVDRWNVESDREQLSLLLDAHASYVESDRVSEAAQHYYQAPVWINEGWARTAGSLEELGAIFEDQLVWLRARGYSHTTVTDRQIHMLSPSSALATVIFEREDTRGNAMDPGEFAVTYVLIRTEQDWRITAVLPHEPERTPWAS